jgi:hypothetical protein
MKGMNEKDFAESVQCLDEISSKCAQNQPNIQHGIIFFSHIPNIIKNNLILKPSPPTL